MTEVSMISIDLAKSIFHIHGTERMPLVGQFFLQEIAAFSAIACFC